MVSINNCLNLMVQRQRFRKTLFRPIVDFKIVDEITQPAEVCVVPKVVFLQNALETGKRGIPPVISFRCVEGDAVGERDLVGDKLERRLLIDKSLNQPNRGQFVRFQIVAGHIAMILGRIILFLGTS